MPEGCVSLCVNDDTEGAEILCGVMQISLGGPKAIDIPSYGADPNLVASLSCTRSSFVDAVGDSVGTGIDWQMYSDRIHPCT